MHRRQFLHTSLGVAGATLATGCSSEHPAYRPDPTIRVAMNRPAELEKMFGGKDGLGPLKSPDKFEAFRLQDSEYQESIDQYKVVDGPVAVDRSTAAKLAELLTDPNSYLWDIAKGCIPVYGVRLRLVKDKKTLDILFCFQCDILLNYVNGKPVAGEDFDPIRPQLVAIMKSLFPNDSAIQKLTETGCSTLR